MRSKPLISLNLILSLSKDRTRISGFFSVLLDFSFIVRLAGKPFHAFPEALY